MCVLILQNNEGCVVDKTSQGRGSTKTGAGRKLDNVRQFFVECEKSGKVIGWQCIDCRQLVSSKSCRMKIHRQKCNARKKVSEKVNKESKCTVVVSDHSGDDEACTSTSSSATRKRTNSTSICGGEKYPESNKKIKVQQKIDGHVFKTTQTIREKIDISVAEYFYSSNVPFRHADKHYFRTMIHNLRPGYTPPSRKRLANDLLDQIYTVVCDDARKRLQGKSVTLIQDGWSAIHNDPVIASCVSDGQCAYFLSSVDTEMNHKTTEYCLKLATEAIEEAQQKYGCIVKSFVSDNEAKMKKMRQQLQDTYSKNQEFHFIVYGCASHYLNLLGEDICKTPNINSILKQITEVSKYFRNHHVAKGYLSSMKGSRIPQIPATTRWNSQLDCLKIFMINKEYYSKIAEDYEDDIDNNISKTMQNIGLMKEVKHLIKQLEPIGIALDRLQGDNSTIADCFHEFITINRVCQTGALLEPYAKNVETRFADCITPAHIVAFLLHPKYMDIDLDPEYEETARSWIRDKVNPNFLPLMTQFALKSSPFPGTFFDKEMITVLSPIEWWQGLARNKKIDRKFSEFALHLFRCVSSSASIERIFSNYSYIQNNIRNRLGLDRASKLVMVYRMLNLKVKEKEDYEDINDCDSE